MIAGEQGYANVSYVLWTTTV